jgi:hypothetical protein
MTLGYRQPCCECSKLGFLARYSACLVLGICSEDTALVSSTIRADLHPYQQARPYPH